MSEAAPSVRLSPVARWGFTVFMLALTVLFVVLGTWQVNRLGEKETLISAVESRADRAPAPLPAVSDWPTIDPEAFDYLPLTVTGSFRPDATVTVFTSLSEARGSYGGAGYWIMTPLVVANGTGVVWVNRGFVPQDSVAEFADGAGVDAETVVTLEGLARKPEAANSFTPEASLPDRQEWVRDPARLAAFLPPDLANLPAAPVTLDRFAGETGELPQAGETVMTFSNRHLEYAGTWYAFALITPLMLGFWWWRQRKG